MECTKGKMEVWSHFGRGWAVQIICEDNKDALSGRDFDEAEANAQELVRRWNAFEKDGLVDELRTAFKELAATFVGLPEGSIGGQAMKKAEAAIAKVT